MLDFWDMMFLSSLASRQEAQNNEQTQILREMRCAAQGRHPSNRYCRRCAPPRPDNVEDGCLSFMGGCLMFMIIIPTVVCIVALIVTSGSGIGITTMLGAFVVLIYALNLRSNRPARRIRRGRSRRRRKDDNH